jgi:hypothetical protein
MRNGSLCFQSRIKLDAEGVCRCLPNEAGFGDSSQLDGPRSVGVGARTASCQLKRQACLAAAARTRERDEPAAIQEVIELVQLAEAANEAGGLPRKVVPSGQRRRRCVVLALV